MAYANVTHLAKNMTFFLHSSHRPYSNWLNKEQKIGSDLNPIRNLKNRRFRETYVKRGGSKRTQKKKKNQQTPKKIKKVTNSDTFKFAQVSRTRDDTCVHELVPCVRQPRKAPMYAICIRGRVSLLFRGQHLALTDGIN